VYVLSPARGTRLGSCDGGVLCAPLLAASECWGAPEISYRTKKLVLGNALS
jgi:hypothetical protein